MKILKNLTVQVIIGIILGITVGFFFPAFGEQLKILADLFIKMIKMVIAPIIFLTVVIGIGGMGDMKKVGRIGEKALLYFEIVTTFALAIGIIVVNLLGPGKGFNIDSVGGRRCITIYDSFPKPNMAPLLSFLISFLIMPLPHWLAETYYLFYSLPYYSDYRWQQWDQSAASRFFLSAYCRHFLRHRRYDHESFSIGRIWSNGLYNR